MAVSVSFPGIGSNYSLKDVGKRYAPPKLPLSCACLRFFVSVPELQKQKKSAQLKALRTFLDLGGLWYGGQGRISSFLLCSNSELLTFYVCFRCLSVAVWGAVGKMLEIPYSILFS